MYFLPPTIYYAATLYKMVNNESELINDWIKDLKSSDKIIIVEGLNDKKALVHFDIDENRILTLKKPLFAVVEEAIKLSSTTKGVIILTDLDKKGKEIYGKLNRDLIKHRIKVDTIFREFLFKETQLRQIEGLIRYVKRKENK